MPLSWNEIKDRAIKFSKEWENETSEDAEAKSFWDAFFNVFGISRRRVATFETKITKGNRKDGYVDLLWKKVLLIEHKSSGKDLNRAYQQAIEYFPGLTEDELPQYILVCNFQQFRLYDLDEGKTIEFKLSDFVKNVQHFGFIAGYEKRVFKEQDPVNIKAAEVMGKLHDKLKEVGYTGHPLEVYLVRLLFCLFSDDTTIFEKGIFNSFIEQRTNIDGSDLASKLDELFCVLNTPSDKRLKNIDEQLNAFPYVNGKLFEERLPPASFDSEMRQLVLDCCKLDWSKISPAIFGSMFQSVMNPKERRNIGAHYTSEKNILKLIKPLFLDELQAEYESIKKSPKKLIEFHKKISKLRFLDPACGCGNFLVITYRELRLLEIKILKSLGTKNQNLFNVKDIILLDVDMMNGIEYEEFPARIAEVAMWLIDHQMNMAVSAEFGLYFVRLPLKKAANIVHGNALQTDWETIVPGNQLSYILGNPPFIGKQLQNVAQKSDMELVFNGVSGAGVLDYVAAWYIKAAQYLHKHNMANLDIGILTRVAFVSTNSIAQGEQIGILWNELFNRYNIKIHFAHRTFKWGNEAKGNAAVHVVIIGFANFDISDKLIYEYDDIRGEPHELKVKNINPYLVEGKDLTILKRSKPICNVPDISFGSMPNDGGFLLLSDNEKNELLNIEPEAKTYIKPLLSADEYLNGEKRWCLWFINANPADLRKLTEVAKRVEGVRQHRAKSTRKATNKLSVYPTLFGENRQPDTDYILIPRVSSENRKYIPMGFFSSKYIIGDTCLFVPKGSLYHFGVLTSLMHMAWVKYVCGRLKSDFRYSNEMVYNNYPWPEKPSDKQKDIIEKAAQKVLNAREQFPKNSLADLYDPLYMPPALIKAHNELDKAVDLAYRPQPFPNETKRIEFLFDLYEKYINNLFAVVKIKSKQQKNNHGKI